jgi:hypothetical protein
MSASAKRPEGNADAERPVKRAKLSADGTGGGVHSADAPSDLYLDTVGLPINCVARVLTVFLD